jgi:hypothetical protein
MNSATALMASQHLKELKMSGASGVTVIDKRTAFTRNNILLLWPSTIRDLYVAFALRRLCWQPI